MLVVSSAISQEPPDSNDHDWFVHCTYMLLLESRDWSASHRLLILDVCFKVSLTPLEGFHDLDMANVPLVSRSWTCTQKMLGLMSNMKSIAVESHATFWEY